MLRYIQALKGSLAMVALGAMLSGCTADDIDTPRDTASAYASDTQLVINLAVPGESDSSVGSRSDVPDSGDPSMTPTAEEAAVNNLRVVLYNTGTGAVTVRSMLAPAEMPINPDKTATYELKSIDKGTYMVYIFANLADVVEGIATKTDLDEALINYGSDGRSLQAGNLPMVYEGSAAVEVKAADDANPAPVIDATLTFACAKVRMNLVFDKSDTDVQAMFGSSGINISSLTLKNLSTNSRVLYNPGYCGAATDTQMPLTDGKFYTSFTTNSANASANDAYVLNVSGSGSSTLAAPASTWVWQADFYVPEHYASANSRALSTQLYIEAFSTTAAGAQSNITMNYTIDLGRIGDFTGQEVETDNSIDVVRGKLYEIIGRFKSYNNGEITTSISAIDWVTTTINTDMVATYLTLSKTTASVASLETDQIAYSTDARGVVGFECESPLIGDSKQAPVKMTTGDGVLTFEVNPEIDITTLSNDQQSTLKGTATCYVTAGNIRKQVLIDYDITPFFIVKPLEQKIQYAGDLIQATKEYTYQTNLGGIIISSGTATSGVIIGPSSSTGTNTVSSSTIRYDEGQSLSEAVGSFSVTATTNPGTTTVHTLTAYPASATSGQYTSLAQTLTVTVLPPLPDYRIYFRAINDYMDMTVVYSGNDPQYATASEYLNGNYSLYRTEGGVWNWADWWTPGATGDTPNTDHHRVYIYTQIGETYGSGDDEKMTAWIFTNGYGSSSTNDSYMTADTQNPGWYYFDQPRTDPVTVDGETKNPEPGKTLIIFYNNEETNLGYALHRCSHHNDPGITLFDYEDREGYYVYDPTMIPYYRVYDERPQVIDAEYVVYSKTQITSWENSYGIANNQTQYENPRLFTIKYTFTSSDGFRSTETINGTTWHKTTIKLKALADDKAKGITLNGLSRTTSQPQYAYYGYSSAGGFDNPYIYVFRGNGGSGNEVKAWPGEAMTYWLTNSNGVKIYRYEIPSGYENGTVVFNNGSNDDGKSPDLALGGQSKLTYSDNLNYWVAYGDQPDNAVVLNDGNDFSGSGPTFTVTFDGDNWYSGKPSN